MLPSFCHFLQLILWRYENLTYGPVLIIWTNIRQFTNDRGDWEEYYSLLLLLLLSVGPKAMRTLVSQSLWHQLTVLYELGGNNALSAASNNIKGLAYPAKF